MHQTDPGAIRRPIARAQAFALWWLALLVLWLALVGKAEPLELIAGAVSALVAATGASVVRQRDEVRFAIRPGQAALLFRRLPGKVLTDCLKLSAALSTRLAGGAIQGRTRTIAFDPGPVDSARAAARRALVVAAISLAPNTFVVDVDVPGSQLLVHDLTPVPDAPPSNPEWPL